MSANNHSRGLTRLETIVLLIGAFAMALSLALVYRYKIAAPRAAPEAQLVATVTPREPADPIEAVRAEQFRNHRSAGLTALEKSQYDLAVSEFTAALRVGRADSDIVQLLTMAQEFKAKQPSTPAVAVVAPAPLVAVPVAEAPRSAAPAAVRPSAPAPSRTAAVRRDPPRPAPRPSLAAVEPAPAPAPQPATLVITSTPSGLTVDIDGARRDTTPFKVVVTPGSHSLTLWRNDKRLMLKTVKAEAGQIQSVEFEEEHTAPVEPQEPEPVAAVTAPAPAPVTAAAVGGETTRPAPSASAPVGATGELLIQSLNVYGEVFVNDKSYGYPPVVAKGLPASAQNIEVRVDGTVKRRRTVEVVANQRTTVRIP